ncbi:sensor histidine kinase [Streptoverticillium reticulum]|uniref:sensor histidine kinase n=1 Tax=Streptoverticillium reticulum TaxID=1433415 RepID=UPI0039BF2DAC
MIVAVMAAHAVDVGMVRPHATFVGSDAWAVLMNIATALAFFVMRGWGVFAYAIFSGVTYVATDFLLPVIAASYGLGALLRTKWRAPAIAAQTVLVLLAVTVGSYRHVVTVCGSSQAAFFTGSCGPLDWVFRMGVPVTAGFVLGAWAEIMRELRWMNQLISREQEERIRAVRAHERTAVAREMHDELGHRLAIVSLYSGALEQSDSLPTEVRKIAQLMNESIISTQVGLRKIIELLRSENEEEVAARTAGDLNQLVELARGASLAVVIQCDWSFYDNLSVAVRAALYRILQESLTNSLKHAAGSTVRICMDRDGETVKLSVQNSAGRRRDYAAVAGGGKGIIGLSERARMLGGTLHAGQTEDGGFELRAEIPIPSTLEVGPE